MSRQNFVSGNSNSDKQGFAAALISDLDRTFFTLHISHLIAYAANRLKGRSSNLSRFNAPESFCNHQLFSNHAEAIKTNKKKQDKERPTFQEIVTQYQSDIVNAILAYKKKEGLKSLLRPELAKLFLELRNNKNIKLAIVTNCPKVFAPIIKNILEAELKEFFNALRAEQSEDELSDFSWLTIEFNPQPEGGDANKNGRIQSIIAGISTVLFFDDTKLHVSNLQKMHTLPQTRLLGFQVPIDTQLDNSLRPWQEIENVARRHLAMDDVYSVYQCKADNVYNNEIIRNGIKKAVDDETIKQIFGENLLFYTDVFQQQFFICLPKNKITSENITIFTNVIKKQITAKNKAYHKEYGQFGAYTSRESIDLSGESMGDSDPVQEQNEAGSENPDISVTLSLCSTVVSKKKVKFV
jgi:hypothetical protein